MPIMNKEGNLEDKRTLWERTLNEIESLISKANFTTWFQHTDIEDSRGGTVYINVPNSFTKEWIQNKYNKHILSAMRKMDPSIKAIEYLICSKPMQNKPNYFKYKTQEPEAPQLGFNEFYETNDSLNPRYTFDNFVVGSFNELAHAAATAVTKNPGSLYNPLFIYGGVGLGKTHLLQAIGNKIKETNPRVKAKYRKIH
jgi:chromosomal replication initiator protein